MAIHHCQGVDEKEGRPSDDEGSSSSDDEHTWTAEVKQQHRLLKRKQLMEREMEAENEKRQARLFEMKEGEEIGVKKDRKEKSERR